MSEPAELDPFGAEWDRPRWTNRLTWVLVAAVVAALAFAGGLLIERQYDTTLLTTARGTARPAGGGLAVAGLGGGRSGAGRAANASGSGAGGCQWPSAAAGSASGGASGGAGDGGGSGGASGARGGAAGSGAGAGGGDAPIAVGTVASVNADRLTLTNFAGKTITVTVPPNATVTTTSGLAGLKPGAPASVTAPPTPTAPSPPPRSPAERPADDPPGKDGPMKLSARGSLVTATAVVTLALAGCGGAAATTNTASAAAAARAVAAGPAATPPSSRRSPSACRRRACPCRRSRPARTRAPGEPPPTRTPGQNRGGGQFADPKVRAALQACGITLPTRPPGANGGGTKPTATA